MTNENGTQDNKRQFTASIRRNLAEAREKRVQRDHAETEMQEFIGSHVTPHMPRSLLACYHVFSVSPGFIYPLRDISIVLKPSVDMMDSEASRLAVGTIEKVSAGLQNGGWQIEQAPSASAQEYTNSMTVSLSAQLELARSAWQRLREPNGMARTLRLSMSFLGIKETDRCHLVEKEITVAATAEHIEKRFVVECNDPVEEPAETVAAS